MRRCIRDRGHPVTTTEPAPPSQQPPPQQQVVVAPPSQPPEEPPEEDSTLLPALLIVYGVYLGWRGAHDAVPTGWRQVVAALGLRSLIGTQLAMIAARALDRQRRDVGRAGDELWMHTDVGIQAGVEAGLQAVAAALIWTDRHAPGGGDPVTKDAAEDGSTGGTVPTAGQPPDVLAAMAALATMNAAVFAVATAVGWPMKQWWTRRDARVRETHRALQGKKVPMASSFVSPSGARLRYPGDPKAPVAERANCRCFLRIARR